MPKKDKKDKKNEEKPVRPGNGDSPIIIADSSTTGDPRVLSVSISHPHFHGAVEVSVSDPGFKPIALVVQNSEFPTLLSAPWMVTVNNSIHISCIDGVSVHVHFNNMKYDVGVLNGNPAFVVSGAALNSVTLMNGIAPNKSVSNDQIVPPGGSPVQITFGAVSEEKRKKK
ncbi:MAG TPA: hypothetical protein VKU19_15090 [Bryobacteraceae bacterium]|nr:hypothetical protein [Bryobacteraceae bacterium]